MEYITVLLIVVDFILLGIAIYLTIDSFKAKAELRQAQEEYEELKRELIFKNRLRNEDYKIKVLGKWKGQ